MRHAIETGRALYEQHRGFAWYPVITPTGWLWLRSYWMVVKHWGWGFIDEWRFATEIEADTAFDRLLAPSQPRVTL